MCEESRKGVRYCEMEFAGASPELRWRQRGVVLACVVSLSLADLRVPPACLTAQLARGRGGSGPARCGSVLCAGFWPEKPPAPFNLLIVLKPAEWCCLLLTLKSNLKCESGQILFHSCKETFCEPYPTGGSCVGQMVWKWQVFCQHVPENLKWAYLEKYKSNGSESNCSGKFMKMPNK